MSLMDAPLSLVRQLSAVMLEVQRQRDLRPDAPLLIDFFSCQGSTSYGYYRAGFIVVGVDIEPQPNYPFPMVVADAVQWAKLIIEFLRPDAVAGSPPCQFGSDLQYRTGRQYPQLIEPFRAAIASTGLPYVIENVESARVRAILCDPVRLCGSLLPEPPIVDSLLMRRHRLFETNWGFEQPVSHGADGKARSCLCAWGKKTGLWRGFINVHGGGAYREGRKPDGSRDGHGNKASFAEAQQLLRVDWMTQHGMNESAPWAYTEQIGRALAEHLQERKAA
jgi:DNA (cytosine-5)-methyltransferase 1